MTVHFAAARCATRSPIARALARRTISRAANDNGNPEADMRSDAMLQASLRHFAKHGLAAASEARLRAEQAFFAGDREGYDWWFGICRTLDRRMAEEFARARRG